MHRRVIVPARVNVIGEHTDYANGLALPFAIDKKLELVIKPLNSGFKGDELVIAMWQALGGYPAELSITSEIPIGKGMSSSAALCVALVVGLNLIKTKWQFAEQHNNLSTTFLAHRVAYWTKWQ